jgi:signal peptidase II
LNCFPLIGFLFLLLDQATKYFAANYLSPFKYWSWKYPYGGIGVFKNFLGIEFSLVYQTNTGAAWNLFADFPEALLSFRVVFIAVLLVHCYRLPQGSFSLLPLTLIITGALSNVIDSLWYGHVIDMLHFVLWGYSFPTFNLADSLICSGAFLYFVMSRYDSKACA